MVTQMIEVGEETGQISAMLDKVADFYDHEVETATESLTAAIEPVMVVVMGALVGVDGHLPLPADVHDLPAHRGEQVTRPAASAPPSSRRLAVAGRRRRRRDADTASAPAAIATPLPAFDRRGLERDGLGRHGRVGGLLAPLVTVAQLGDQHLLPAVKHAVPAASDRAPVVTRRRHLRHDRRSQATDPAPGCPTQLHQRRLDDEGLLQRDGGVHASPPTACAVNLNALQGYADRPTRTGYVRRRAQVASPTLSVARPHRRLTSASSHGPPRPAPPSCTVHGADRRLSAVSLSRCAAVQVTGPRPAAPAACANSRGQRQRPSSSVSSTVADRRLTGAGQRHGDGSLLHVTISLSLSQLLSRARASAPIAGLTAASQLRPRPHPDA